MFQLGDSKCSPCDGEAWVVSSLGGDSQTVLRLEGGVGGGGGGAFNCP